MCRCRAACGSHRSRPDRGRAARGIHFCRHDCRPSPLVPRWASPTSAGRLGLIEWIRAGHATERRDRVDGCCPVVSAHQDEAPRPVLIVRVRACPWRRTGHLPRPRPVGTCSARRRAAGSDRCPRHRPQAVDVPPRFLTDHAPRIVDDHVPVGCGQMLCGERPELVEGAVGGMVHLGLHGIGPEEVARSDRASSPARPGSPRAGSSPSARSGHCPG